MSSLLILGEDFAAAHLYFQPKWSPEENAAVFGKCFSEHGHGHNYRLEAGFLGPSAPASTLQKELRGVVDLLDHKHLNFVVPEFKKDIPTLENIAIYFLKKLQERCPNETVSYIKLFEAENLWVEIRTETAVGN
jgi:6-pyruvoyltetrahydropterin/6-carboxytetrahydropterin synthase